MSWLKPQDVKVTDDHGHPVKGAEVVFNTPWNIVDGGVLRTHTDRGGSATGPATSSTKITSNRGHVTKK